ncbi:MAG: HD domain-containing protein [Clostridia bacterium]|nr:HD domain-containing protein [Clostridia bacterium]
MNSYLENLRLEVKEYYNILNKGGIPEFLVPYIETKEMQKLEGISVSCGTIYSKIFDYKWYSTLEHSIGVALIIWNFTKDKKQTLSGLFHDIATPVFKHTIDFMNEDYETQESTEELTSKIIGESKEIMSLLTKDGIKLEEVVDYHIYPIADNDTPMLSSDRLEYTLSNGLGATAKLWDLKEVKEIYEDIEVQKNEKGIEELGFKTKEIAEKFVHNMSKLSSMYIQNKVKISMQFLADTIKKMLNRKLITEENLYTLTEKEMIEKIENCKYDNISKCFDLWKNATGIKESNAEVERKILS